MKLSENYRIVTDENNVTLEFFETRKRTNKETKEEVEYEYTQQMYFPTVKTALKRFLQEYIKPSNSIEEVLRRINEVELIIDNVCQQ